MVPGESPIGEKFQPQKKEYLACHGPNFPGLIQSTAESTMVQGIIAIVGTLATIMVYGVTHLKTGAGRTVTTGNTGIFLSARKR